MRKFKLIIKIALFILFMFVLGATLEDIAEPLSIVIEKCWWIFLLGIIYLDIAKKEPDKHSQ